MSEEACMAISRDPIPPEGYGQYIGQLEKICLDFHIDSLMPSISAVGESIQASDMINVALVGGFKAGKSSFINSLIGGNILPVAVLPVTAVITYVRFGSQDQAKIIFINGQTLRISLDKIFEYITEQSNPENLKNVERVDVELSNLQAYPNVQFVDTPGLGSVFKHNTATSRHWLPRIGAALLAISVEHPLSEEDIELLRELSKYTPEMIILLTKADLVSRNEQDDVVKFIERQVRQQLSMNIRVLPFSIRPEYESLRLKVSEYLQQSIAVQSVKKTGKIISHKLHTMIASCREYLLLARSAVNSTRESRQKLLQQLQREQRLLSSIQNEIWLLSNDLKSRMQTESSELFQKSYANVLNGLVGNLQTQIGQWKGNLAKTSKAFKQWAEANLTERLEVLSKTIGSNLAEQHLNASRESFSRMVQAFQNRLSKSVEEALGLTFKGASFDAWIVKPSQPDVQVGRVFDTELEIIWFLIPMWLFRPLVNRHFLGMLPWEVEKNLYRLASQWSEAIQRSIDDLAQQAEGFITDELATIENLLRQAPDRRAEIEKSLADLEMIENEMHAIKPTLR
jgi:GTP-binding protein EngB required for normal cell division